MMYITSKTHTCILNFEDLYSYILSTKRPPYLQ